MIVVPSLYKILRDRSWHLSFSFQKRKCYISGQSLWLSLAYKGVKPNTNSLDYLWLSKKEYLKNLASNTL